MEMLLGHRKKVEVIDDDANRQRFQGQRKKPEETDEDAAQHLPIEKKEGNGSVYWQEQRMVAWEESLKGAGPVL